jgi:hypothetical protein
MTTENENVTLKSQIKVLKVTLALFFIIGVASLSIIVAHLHHDAFAFERIETSLKQLEKQVAAHHAGDKNVGKN